MLLVVAVAVAVLGVLAGIVRELLVELAVTEKTFIRLRIIL